MCQELKNRMTEKNLGNLNTILLQFIRVPNGISQLQPTEVFTG